MKSIINVLIIFILSSFLFECHGHSRHQTNTDTIIVELKPTIKDLFFNSKVEPIKTYEVISTVDGFIEKMYFNYGIWVAQDQLLCVISSPQAHKDFRDALVNYMKTKLDYTNAKTLQQENNELNKLGLISKNEYTSTASQTFDANVGYQTAKHHLVYELEKFNVPASFFVNELDSIQPEFIDTTIKTITPSIPLFSPKTGVIMPVKDTILNIGTPVKAGDSIAEIGDKSAFKFAIQINEVDINDIHPGQEAIITSDDFPSFSLKGVVLYVEKIPSSKEDIATYRGHILVPISTLTEKEDLAIRLGMNVKVKLPIRYAPSIQIPLSAVYQKNNHTYVKVIDKNTGDEKEVPIIPGLTTMDTIEIQSGLHAGDEVVIHGNNPAN